MKSTFLMAFIAVLALFLSSCKDVIDRPLVMSDAQSDLSSLKGEWVSESESEKLHMVLSQKNQNDLFEVELKYDSSLVYGLLKISRFEENYILNVDLSSISYDGVGVFEGLGSRYVLLGAYFDRDKLVVVPADMDVFLEKFNKYYELKSEKIKGNCASIETDRPLKTNICRSFLSGVNVVSLGAYGDFHEDLMSSYKHIFPMDDALFFRKE